ncbi:MAG: hypothetical protein BWY83_00874 [bacterium ADurb.Bin478]|nr:MAG: hypothetical protein BWY83_00874 [bacterium ADurb.Bin478]
MRFDALDLKLGQPVLAGGKVHRQAAEFALQHAIALIQRGGFQQPFLNDLIFGQPRSDVQQTLFFPSVDVIRNRGIGGERITGLGQQVDEVFVHAVEQSGFDRLQTPGLLSAAALFQRIHLLHDQAQGLRFVAQPQHRRVGHGAQFVPATEHLKQPLLLLADAVQSVRVVLLFRPPPGPFQRIIDIEQRIQFAGVFIQHAADAAAAIDPFLIERRIIHRGQQILLGAGHLIQQTFVAAVIRHPLQLLQIVIEIHQPRQFLLIRAHQRIPVIIDLTKAGLISGQPFRSAGLDLRMEVLHQLQHLTLLGQQVAHGIPGLVVEIIAQSFFKGYFRRRARLRPGDRAHSGQQEKEEHHPPRAKQYRNPSPAAEHGMKAESIHALPFPHTKSENGA